MIGLTNIIINLLMPGVEARDVEGKHIPAHDLVIRPLLRRADECLVFNVDKESEVYKKCSDILIKDNNRYKIDLSKEVITGYELFWNAVCNGRGDIVIVMDYNKFDYEEIFNHIWHTSSINNLSTFIPRSVLKYCKELVNNGKITFCLPNLGGIESLIIIAPQEHINELFIQGLKYSIENNRRFKKLKERNIEDEQLLEEFNSYANIVKNLRYERMNIIKIGKQQYKLGKVNIHFYFSPEPRIDIYCDPSSEAGFTINSISLIDSIKRFSDIENKIISIGENFFEEDRENNIDDLNELAESVIYRGDEDLEISSLYIKFGKIKENYIELKLEARCNSLLTEEIDIPVEANVFAMINNETVNSIKKITVGDVFAIQTPKGEAYLQYVYKNRSNIETIRVLPGLFLDRPADLAELVNQKELFLVGFPLATAFRRKIVKFVGNYPIPSNFKKSKYMRSDFIDEDGNKIWHIIDTETGKYEVVKKLSEEQKMLSPYEIWNDTLLIERLTEGWTLDKWV